jgi:hypothetical protein
VPGHYVRLAPVRIVRIGLTLVALLATVTACTPGRQPLLAIAMVHGTAVAVLRTCVPGPAEISVTENSQAPTTSPGTTTPTAEPTPDLTPSTTASPTTDSYVYSWSITTAAAPALNEVPLFFTPVGWTLERNTLTKLRPGARYIADAKVSGIFDVSPVNFTVTDLDSLKEGEVLYGINAPLTTVLTRQEFEAKTEQACLDSQPTRTP